jgi:hypothetical protein
VYNGFGSGSWAQEQRKPSRMAKRKRYFMSGILSNNRITCHGRKFILKFNSETGEMQAVFQKKVSGT